MKPPSLRARLVLLTTAAVAVVWLAAAALTWRAALHEIGELLDHPPATQQHLARDRGQLAHEIAEHLLMPMIVALPGLALVLAAAIGYSLRPLRRLADEVSARAPGRLTPISDAGVPREIAPLVGRLNVLFGEIGRALENERRFTADASHELRTPLAALRAQAQVALAATDDAQREHALRQILAGCDRATRLLGQLLTLARLDADHAPTMAPLSLRALAAELLAEDAGEALARGCELTLGEGDAQVLGDAALLGAALRNLVENALRHGAAHTIQVEVATEAGRAVLAVTDDGRGIPAAEREAVQQRFRRGASADSEGSGLGLSIVRRIAVLHGGSMALCDPPAGQGLAVRLRLPLAA